MLSHKKDGAWHLHIIYIFEKKRPYIPKSDFEKLWGFGFVNIKDLKDKEGKNIDNLGIYLSMYLSSMVEDDGKNGKNLTNKRIIKGKRLRTIS